MAPLNRMMKKSRKIFENLAMDLIDNTSRHFSGLVLIERNLSDGLPRGLPPTSLTHLVSSLDFRGIAYSVNVITHGICLTNPKYHDSYKIFHKSLLYSGNTIRILRILQ